MQQKMLPPVLYQEEVTPQSRPISVLRRPDLPLLLHRSIHPAISRSEFILYESQSVVKTFWLGFRGIAFEKTGWLHGSSALIIPSTSQHLAGNSLHFR
jgi:hypothetical protein